MGSAFRHFGVAVVLSVLVSGCSDPEREGPSTINQPLATDATETNPPALPAELYRIEIPQTAQVFFPMSRIQGVNGKTFLIVTMEDYGTLITFAKEGNGSIQQALSAVLLRLDVKGSRSDIVDVLAGDLCPLAEQGKAATVSACAYYRLKRATNDQEIESALSLLHPIQGFRFPFENVWQPIEAGGKPNNDCGSEVKAYCLANWDRARGAKEIEALGLVNATRQLTDSILFCDPGEDDCNSRADELGNHLTRANTISTQRVVLQELPRALDFHSGFQQFSSSTKQKLQKIFDRAVGEVDSTDERVGHAYRSMLKCLLRNGSDLLSCNSATHYNQLEPQDQVYLANLLMEERTELGCAVLSDHWHSLVHSGGWPELGYAGLAECLASGEGVPQDFSQSRKVARWYFLSGPLFESSESAIALATTGVLPPMQENAVEQAYFARNVLGHDKSVEFAGRPVPSRDVLLKHIDASSIPRLQSRSLAWVELYKTLSSADASLIAWMDYYGILKVDLLDSADSSGSGTERGTQGTGFAVTRQGHVVTNAHVVHACKKLEVGKEHSPAEIIASDATNDLALLKTDMQATPLPLGLARLQLGSAVSVLGYPLSGISGGQLVATTGVVSALAGIGGDSRHFQFSAPIQPGSSGGPVIDERGSVIGVVVSTADAKAVHEVSGAIPQNMNYAIRSSILGTFLSNHIDLDAGSLRAETMGDAIGKASKSTYEVRCVQ